MNFNVPNDFSSYASYPYYPQCNMVPFGNQLVEQQHDNNFAISNNLDPFYYYQESNLGTNDEPPLPINANVGYCMSSTTERRDADSSTYSPQETPVSETSSTCEKIKKPVKKKRKNEQAQVRQRYAANQRERRRMENINHAFDGLRNRVPTAVYEKRLSKVDTLRQAIAYINHLNSMLTSSGNNKVFDKSDDGTSSSSFGQPPKIIVAHPNSANCTSPETSRSSLMGHSLSWNRIGNDIVYGSSMKTKVWVPSMAQQSSFSA